MRFHPFGTRLFPAELPPFLALNPLVLSNLFFDEISDPIKRISQHHWRHLDILLSLKDLAHIASVYNLLGLDIEKVYLVHIQLDGDFLPHVE